MPDDQISTEVAEQEQVLTPDVDEALNSFLEDDEDETAGDIPLESEMDETATPAKETEKKPDEAEKKETGKTPAKKAGKETGKEKEGKKEGETDDDETYPEALADRLKKTSGMQESVEKPPAKPAAPEPAPKEKPPAKAPEILDNLLSIDDLPDKDIKVGDVSVNLKEYKKDYPEDFAAIMAVGSILAKSIVQKQLQTGQYVKADLVADLHNKVKDLEFWDEIALSHPDARKINKDSDFLDWLDKQDEPLKRLARNMETPEDGVLILDFYKKSKAAKKAADFDAAAKGKKKRTDDLHKGTMRNKATVKQTDGFDANDAEAAFNEDDDD